MRNSFLMKWVLLGTMLALPRQVAIAQQADPPASLPEESIELIHQGKTIRVPIKSGVPDQIRVGDKVLTIRLSDSEAPPPSESAKTEAQATTNAASAEAASKESLPREMLILGGVLGTLVVGLFGYIFVVDPLRRRRPLKAALAIITENRKAQFRDAEELLDQSLLAGLRKKDIAAARFALAFLRSSLGKYEEASTVLQDLEKSKTKIDRPVAYLMLYVNSKLQNHERVERIYREHETLLTGFQQSELLASIAFLGIARLRWARREISGAMFYFNEVRKLKVLATEVPGHIDDHEIVVGVSSLFEKNVEAARRHFQASLDEAQRQNKPGYSGRLGLALCQWISGEEESIEEDLENLLSEIAGDAPIDQRRPVETVCPHCSQKYKVKPRYLGKQVKCTNCRRRFEIRVLDMDLTDDSDDVNESNDSTEPRLLTDEDQLLANARVWHCVVQLAGWENRKPLSGLPESDRRLFHGRLKKVIQIDPDMGDPYLMGGLIDYYFARNEQERRRGLEQIEKSLACDVHVPEVLQLRDREHKLSSLSEQSAGFFLKIAKQYAENGEVDPEYREQFLKKINQFRRIQELGGVNADLETHTVPTLENLKGRGQILATRVSNILRYRDDIPLDLREHIADLLEEMHERSDQLSDSAKAVQQTEFDVMNNTSDVVFSDEDPDVFAREDESPSTSST